MRGTIRTLIAMGVLVAPMSLATAQDPVAADYEATPFFVEDFGTGATPGYVGEWDFLPLLTTTFTSGIQTPEIITATPGTLAASFVTADPVAGSDTGAVLRMGNLSTDAAATAGLNYWICYNSEAGGTGDDFANLDNYRAVARVFLPSIADAPGRFQVGLIGYSGAVGTLFEMSVYYNTHSEGNGPGFGIRSVVGAGLVPGTSAYATSDWRLVSIMMKGNRVALGVDANGDGTIDESDPLEYQVYDRNTAHDPFGPFGFFTVNGGGANAPGGVNFDERPMLIDWVEVYDLVVLSTADESWNLYD